jgi:hypothetical protein
LYETASRTTRYISVLKENVDIFLKTFKIWVKFSDTDIDVSVKIFCCLTCYKSFNSFCRSDTGEEVMCQSFQYINTCLHRYNFDDSVSYDNVDLWMNSLFAKSMHIHGGVAIATWIYKITKNKE